MMAMSFTLADLLCTEATALCLRLDPHNCRAASKQWTLQAYATHDSYHTSHDHNEQSVTAGRAMITMDQPLAVVLEADISPQLKTSLLCRGHLALARPRRCMPSLKPCPIVQLPHSVARPWGSCWPVQTPTLPQTTSWRAWCEQGSA